MWISSAQAMDAESFINQIKKTSNLSDPNKGYSAVVMTQAFVDILLKICPERDRVAARAWQKRNGQTLSQLVERFKQDPNKQWNVRQLHKSAWRMLEFEQDKGCQVLATMVSDPALDLGTNNAPVMIALKKQYGTKPHSVASNQSTQLSPKQNQSNVHQMTKGYGIVVMNKHVESEGMEWDGSGWSQAFKVSVYALFANGEYWVNPSVAPQHLNPVKEKQAHPEQWGRWRRSGNTIWITNHQGKQTKLPGFRVASIRSGTKLNGSWSNRGVGSVSIGSSSGYWSSSKSIRFFPGGRFQISKSQTTASSTSSSGTNTGTFGNRQAPIQRGRYQFNGHSVNLNYDNGQSIWLLSYAIDHDNYSYGRLLINDREYRLQ